MLENVTDMSPDSSDVTGMMTDAVNDRQEFNASLVCRSQDDLFKSRVVATVHTFLDACVPSSKTILSDSWDLCTPTGTFDCTDVLKYTSICQFAKQSTRCSSPIPPSPPARCGIEQMVDQTEGLLLLIGILLLGILIGVASAVAVCLICPKIHSWMHSKLQTKIEITREMSYDTDYTDIDDRMVGAIPDYQSSDMALYSVSNISSNSSDYTGSDYDTTNMLHSPRQRDQYIYRGRDDAIQNRNARDTQISQSNIKCDGAKANGSAGKCETQGRNSHVLGLT